MTIDQFRQMALTLPDVEERSHMGHPDFRVKGKIFATLGAPDRAWGMVALDPERQREYVQPGSAFMPAQGAWGRGGATLVRLDAADPEVVREAMSAAWRNKLPKPRVAKPKKRAR